MFEVRPLHSVKTNCKCQLAVLRRVKCFYLDNCLLTHSRGNLLLGREHVQLHVARKINSSQSCHSVNKTVFDRPMWKQINCKQDLNLK